jgi:hypothetical protein
MSGRTGRVPAASATTRVRNGNTHEVVRASHGIRNGAYATRLQDASDSDEKYDLVVVGAGFAGLAAAYHYRKARPDATVLLLDVHPIFGGEAKQNEFDVDGVHLWGPQGSNGRRLSHPQGDGDGLGRAALARARPARGVRLARAEESLEGAADPVRRLLADARPLGGR